MIGRDPFEPVLPGTPADDGRLERAHAALRVSGQHYFGTGSYGPVPTVYAEALARLTAEDVAHGRATAARQRELAASREALRAEIAKLMSAATDDIVLMPGTSGGLEAVIELWPWQPGDEVVCTDLEHEALSAPLARAALRFGLALRVAAVPREDDIGSSEWLEPLLTERTRLVAFSAVAFETGRVLPARRIAALARKAGAATLMDAAQGAGAIPLEPAALGVDFCALPLQKWLLGPEGLGALCLSAASAERLRERPRDLAVQGRPVLEAAAETLRWQRLVLGRDWIEARTARLADYARRVLADVPGASLLTPAAHAGLVTIGFEQDMTRAADALAERGFVLRYLPERRAFRVSTAFFNTEPEIDALAATLAGLARAR